MRRPTTVKGICSFLGLCGYYRKFVDGFSSIAKPLTDQIKKNTTKIKWNAECQTAFDTLIKCITQPPLLQYPDYNMGFIVTCDASDTGMGAVLSQKIDGIERPIAFISRKFCGAEKRYHINEKEGNHQIFTEI